MTTFCIYFTSPYYLFTSLHPHFILPKRIQHTWIDIYTYLTQINPLAFFLTPPILSHDQPTHPRTHIPKEPLRHVLPASRALCVFVNTEIRCAGAEDNKRKRLFNACLPAYPQ